MLLDGCDLVADDDDALDPLSSSNELRDGRPWIMVVRSEQVANIQSNTSKV